IGFEKDFEAFLSAVGGHEDFLLDLALDPILIVGHFGLGVADVALGQVIAEFLHDVVIHFKAVSDVGLGAEEVGGDAAATGDLAAAVGLTNLRGVLGDFAFVVIFVERDGFVIALNEASAGRVIAGGGEGEAGVFRERRDGLHETLAESGFANDEATVVILDGAGNDFSGG